jgi:hypothetical protein
MSHLRSRLVEAISQAGWLQLGDGKLIWFAAVSSNRIVGQSHECVTGEHWFSLNLTSAGDTVNTFGIEVCFRFPTLAIDSLGS